MPGFPRGGKKKFGCVGEKESPGGLGIWENKKERGKDLVGRETAIAGRGVLSGEEIWTRKKGSCSKRTNNGGTTI